MKSSIVFIFLLSLLIENACFAQLSGVYTVGGYDNNGTLDYKNLSAVFTDLQKQGVNGPVTINIKPGTYNVAAQLKYVPGSSTVNRVIIQAENLDSASVILTHEGSGSTFELWNAQFVTLQYLTIESEGHNGDYNNHVLYIIDPFEVQVKHCRIVASNYYGSIVDEHSPILLKFWEEGIRKNCLITHCTINSDSYGVYAVGGNGSLTFTDNKIFNYSTNSFVSNASSEIYLTGNEMTQSVSCAYNYNKLFFIGNVIHGDIKTDGPGPVFEGNTVDGVAEFAYPVVIKDNVFNGELKLSSDNITLQGNTIATLNFSNDAGLHLYDNKVKDFYCSNAADVHLFRNEFTNSFYLIANEYKPSEIINNTIAGSFEMYAFEMTLAYNNIAADSIVIGWQSVNILNNNFSSGFDFTPYTGSVRDYNNYYPALNSSEAHAYHIDPQYVSSADLHIQNVELHGIDTLFYVLTDDIDGDTRIGHSCIGADAICFPDTFTAGSDLVITCGDSVMLNPFTNSGATFQWISYPSLDTFYNSTPVISPVQDETYVLNAEDQCGHSYSDSILADVESFVVEASIPSYPPPSCGLPVQLSATYLPSYTYHWTPAQFLSDTDTYLTVASSNQPVTTYTVEASHPDCGTAVDSIIVTLNTTMKSDFDVIVYSNLADFINESTFPGWYLWDFGDGSQSLELDPDHIYTTNAWYYVSLYASNDCGGADTFSNWINYNNVGIDEVLPNEQVHLRITPNPFHESAVVRAEGFDEKVSTVQLQIISAMGSIELNQSIEVTKDNFTYALNSSLPAGIYFLRIITNDGSWASATFESQ